MNLPRRPARACPVRRPRHLLLALCLLAAPATAQSSPPIPQKTPLPALPTASSGYVAVDDRSFAVAPDGVFMLEGGELHRRDLGLLSIKASTRERDLIGVPIVADGSVYVLDGVGAVLAFDTATLKRRWRTLLAGTPQRLTPAGPVLVTERGGVVTALDTRSGRVAWQVRGVDTDHSATNARLIGGVVLVNHSPAEGFQGEVYTAHDPATGRRLWRQSVGHGYLLASSGTRLTFDVRDWHNLLDDRNGFRLAEVDAGTGQRREVRRSLAALPGKPGLWEVAPGTPTLEPDGTFWLVVQARNGGGTRLARLTPGDELRLWPLPPSRLGVADIVGYQLALTGGTVVVAAPDGQVTTLAHKTGRTVSVALPGFADPMTLAPLGNRMGVSREGTGVVVLDAAGRVEFRVDGGARPTLAGRTILVAAERGLVLFHLR